MRRTVFKVQQIAWRWTFSHCLFGFVFSFTKIIIASEFRIVTELVKAFFMFNTPNKPFRLLVSLWPIAWYWTDLVRSLSVGSYFTHFFLLIWSICSMYTFGLARLICLLFNLVFGVFSCLFWFLCLSVNFVLWLLGC